jgi:hypothetical protein
MKTLVGFLFIFVGAMAIDVIPAAPIAYACVIAVLGIVISR